MWRGWKRGLEIERKVGTEGSSWWLSGNWDEGETRWRWGSWSVGEAGTGQGQAQRVMGKLGGEKNISAWNCLSQCFHVRKVVFAAEAEVQLHSACCMLDAESWALTAPGCFCIGLGSSAPPFWKWTTQPWSRRGDGGTSGQGRTSKSSKTATLLHASLPPPLVCRVVSWASKSCALQMGGAVKASKNLFIPLPLIYYRLALMFTGHVPYKTYMETQSFAFVRRADQQSVMQGPHTEQWGLNPNTKNLSVTEHHALSGGCLWRECDVISWQRTATCACYNGHLKWGIS